MNWICPQCDTKYESRFDGIHSESDCCYHLLPIDGCDCYKCEEERYMDDGSIKNNFEYHTYGEECPNCGAEKTKYRDLARKGRYVCPECR